MIYVLFHKSQAVHVTSESPWMGRPKMREFPGITYDTAKTANDFKSFHEVELVAEQISEVTGNQWLPFDDGPGTSHRYGILEMFKVGDLVSHTAGSDSYPCGKIVRITKGLRIITEEWQADSLTKLIDTSTPEGEALAAVAQARSDSNKKLPRDQKMFNRRKNTSRWLGKGGHGSLFKGHHFHQDPHF